MARIPPSPKEDTALQSHHRRPDLVIITTADCRIQMVALIYQSSAVIRRLYIWRQPTAKGSGICQIILRGRQSFPNQIHNVRSCLIRRQYRSLHPLSSRFLHSLLCRSGRLLAKSSSRKQGGERENSNPNTIFCIGNQTTLDPNPRKRPKKQFATAKRMESYKQDCKMVNTRFATLWSWSRRRIIIMIIIIRS